MADSAGSAEGPDQQAGPGGDPPAGGSPAGWSTKAKLSVVVAALGVLAAVFTANPGLLQSGGGGGGNDNHGVVRGDNNPVFNNNNHVGVTVAPPAPSPTATAGATACEQRPRTSHGYSAAFVTPCDGDSLPSPYPLITLRVPAYPPHDGSQGSIQMLVRILSNGRGMPLDDQPMYSSHQVEPGTAKRVGRHTWTGDSMIYTSCNDSGPAQILVYWLSPSGTAEARHTWQPGKAAGVPPDSELLDEVTVNMVPGC
ncbi:hypothetical protein [Streptomyces sp.]|uniref:hypothetical protein n=1 Tax=Streptomyces sp. TaxID=1931 RepID=UPI002F3E48D8